MKIYFSHGKKGTPNSNKITKMVEIALKFGFEVDIIDYTYTFNPEERANKLKAILAKEKGKYILVGSSMGAYISLVVSELVKNKPKGLFLLAPALYLDGYKVQNFDIDIKNTVVIHGWNDTIVPYQNSIKFCNEGKHRLHLLDSDHRLESVLNEIVQIFSTFLKTRL